MKYPLLAIILLAFAGAFTWGVSAFLMKSSSAPPTTPTEPLKYQNASLGLSFSYQGGANGYVLEERPAADAASSLLHTIVLTSYDDYTRLQNNPPIGGEGPAVIAISVFQNRDRQFPVAWAMANPEYSSYNLKLNPDEEVVVGGAKALAYNADGLYPARQVIVAHGSYIYVLTGQYMEQNSAMVNDFETLVKSLVFMPEAATLGKIDITVACESALAYMTFLDGAATDAFMTECRNGEHPEVVERYIQGLEMDSAAI